MCSLCIFIREPVKILRITHIQRVTLYKLFIHRIKE